MDPFARAYSFEEVILDGKVRILRNNSQELSSDRFCYFLQIGEYVRNKEIIFWYVHYIALTFF